MRTIQMTLDDDLVKAVDQAENSLIPVVQLLPKGPRALDSYSIEQSERKHREGYERKPVIGDEYLLVGSQNRLGVRNEHREIRLQFCKS